MARSKAKTRQNEDLPAYKRRTGSHHKVPIPVRIWMREAAWLRWPNVANTDSSRWHLDRRGLKPMPIRQECVAVPPEDRKLVFRKFAVPFHQDSVCRACWNEYAARSEWHPATSQRDVSVLSGFPVPGDIPRAEG